MPGKRKGLGNTRRTRFELQEAGACQTCYSRPTGNAEQLCQVECVNGLKITNLCVSFGKKAMPSALLGAEVWVFDISEGNRRYACEKPLPLPAPCLAADLSCAALTDILTGQTLSPE